MSEIASAILEAVQGVNARLDGIAMRMDRMELRMDHFEQRMERMEQRMARSEVQLSRASDAIDDLRARLDLLPDFHLMMARSKVSIERLQEVRSEIAVMRTDTGEMLDLYRTLATAAEVGNLRDEVRLLREADIGRDVRLTALEERIHPEGGPGPA